MDPRIDAGDQVQLPGEPLDLPDAQRGEAQSGEQRQRDGQRASSPPGRQNGSSVIGIMLALRWYMIHSEPAMTISTITAVNR